MPLHISFLFWNAKISLLKYFFYLKLRYLRNICLGDLRKVFVFSFFFHFNWTVLKSFFHLWVTCYDNIMSSYYGVTIIISDTEFGFFEFPLSNIFPKPWRWSYNTNSKNLWSTLQVFGLSKVFEKFHKPAIFSSIVRGYL